MKIRTKIILLSILFIVLFLLVLLMQTRLEQHRIALGFFSERYEKAKDFDMVMNLKGESFDILVKDYTYWDDMVNFVKTGDSEWAKQNLEPALSTFKVDAMWVYDTNFVLTYSINTLNDAEFKMIPVPEDALKNLFQKARIIRFFVQTSKGIMEIRGATIHPTADTYRMSPPQGYFFAGRLCNDAYLSDLSLLVKGKVEIVDVRNQQILMRQDYLKTGTIIFSKPLKSWDGQIIAHMMVSKNSVSVESYKHFSNRIYLILIASITIFLTVLIFYLTLLMVVPLRLISNSLVKEDLNELQELKKKKTEFGEIARLIDKFFQQRDELIKESKERMLTDEKLKSKIAVLELFNKSAMEREARMMELKRQIRELQAKVNHEQTNQFKRLTSLGDFISKMSHELSNPLMVIAGNVQLSLMETIEDKKLEKNLRVVGEQAERVRAMIQKLLLFARPTMVASVESDINALLEDAIQEADTKFDFKNLKVARELSHTLPKLHVDPQQFKDVFLSILKNSQDALPEGGMIIVSTVLQENGVRIQIKDTGRGISPENLSRVFEPFFSTKERCLGLSLAICYGVVRAHKGEIHIESEFGRGTAVSITLPLKS